MIDTNEIARAKRSYDVVLAVLGAGESVSNMAASGISACSISMMAAG